MDTYWLHYIQNSEIVGERVHIILTLVYSVEYRGGSFYCNFMSSWENKKSYTFNVLLTLYQLLSFLEAKFILLDLFGGATIASHPALCHQNYHIVLDVLCKQSHAEIFLEVLLSTLGQLQSHLFQRRLIKEFSDVVGKVELLGAHQYLNALLKVADWEVGSRSQQCLPLIEECLTFFVDYSLKLWVVLREFEIFELFRSWYSLLLLVHSFFRSDLIKDVSKDASHLHGFDHLRILILLAFFHMFDCLVDVVAD